MSADETSRRSDQRGVAGERHQNPKRVPRRAGRNDLLLKVHERVNREEIKSTLILYLNRNLAARVEQACF